MAGRSTRTFGLGKHIVLSILSAAALAFTTLVVSPAPAHAVTDYRTNLTPQWYPNNGVVRAMLVTPDTIYLGGSFTAMRNAANGQTVQRNRLAAIDRSTRQLTSWNPNANDVVWALAQGANGVVYAGGDFTSLGNGTATRIAAITGSGSRLAGFSASANNQVRDFLLAPEGLYVAGKFGNINGAGRSGVARLNPGTGQHDAWRPVLTGGRAFALASAPGGTIVLGGNFDTVNGAVRPNLAWVTNGNAANNTGPVPRTICDCPVIDLDTNGSDIYAAVGGGGGGRATKWDLNDGRIIWNRQGDGDVQTIDYYDDRVYIGGHFGPGFMGQNRHQLAVVSSGSGAITSYSLPFTGNDHPGLWDVHADHTGLFIAGGFAMSGTAVRRFGELAVL